MISALAEYLDQDQADRALEISRTLVARGDLWIAWGALLPRISPAVRPPVLRALTQSAAGAGRFADHLFWDIVPHLSDDETEAFLTEVMGTANIGEHASWLAVRADRLPPGWR